MTLSRRKIFDSNIRYYLDVSVVDCTLVPRRRGLHLLRQWSHTSESTTGMVENNTITHTRAAESERQRNHWPMARQREIKCVKSRGL